MHDEKFPPLTTDTTDKCYGSSVASRADESERVDKYLTLLNGHFVPCRKRREQEKAEESASLRDRLLNTRPRHSCNTQSTCPRRVETHRSIEIPLLSCC